MKINITKCPWCEHPLNNEADEFECTMCYELLGKPGFFGKCLFQIDLSNNFAKFMRITVKVDNCHFYMIFNNGILEIYDLNFTNMFLDINSRYEINYDLNNLVFDDSILEQCTKLAAKILKLRIFS